MTARHRRTGTRRPGTMPRAYSFNMVVGIDTKKMPSLSRQEEALLVVGDTLGCQAGSHRQDLNESELRCGRASGKAHSPKFLVAWSAPLQHECV